jgi:hypothetical protein
MANDPPPPSPPPRRRFFFPFRIEQKGPPAHVQDRASDNEALFIESMQDAARRRIAFNVVERNCREAFARGKEGLALFMQVRSLVERAQVEEALSEFNKRFAPMLDQQVVNDRLRNP